MVDTSQKFILPDLLKSCQFVLRDATNSHYKKAAAESRAWISSYNILSDRKKEYLVSGQSELLCSHAYPYAGYEQFRTISDWINLLFVMDELSDDQTGKEAANTGHIVVKALQNSDWDDGSGLANMTKTFKERLYRRAGPKNMSRFVKAVEEYTIAVGIEAELREKYEVLDVASFIPLRRHNSAVPVCLTLVEYALGIDLPDEIWHHSGFLDAFWAAVDYVCWANDLYSYDMEQAKGHTANNIVTVLMKEKRCTLQEAADSIGIRCDQFLNKYLTAKANLLSNDLSVGPDAFRYIEAIGHWIIGNVVWSFESQRYFGAHHLEIQRTRLVTLRRSPPNSEYRGFAGFDESEVAGQ